MTTRYPHNRLIAFSGSRCIADGLPHQVVPRLKEFAKTDPTAQILTLDATTSRVVELDLRGTADAILAGQFDPSGTGENTPTGAAAGEDGPSARRGRGRPRLGVVSREVTLLPRHWEWLNSQPGGASVALRRLVDDARRGSQGTDRRRRALDAAYRFFTVMAGNEAGYEDAVRALYAADLQRLKDLLSTWPEDVAAHGTYLAESALLGEADNSD